MAYFKGAVLVALACIIYVQSLPLSQSSDDANSYSLVLYFNTTTSMFNGTEVTKPMACSELQVAVYSNKPHSVAACAQALQKEVATLQVRHNFSMSHVVASNLEGNTLPLVFSYNKSAMIDVGPKPESSTIYGLEFNLFAKH